ncbi:uncharacterized protein LOC119598726 [Penaeus monodon]|uniref:uncharacterized protein LOC119598726 n=1 Tax=Penaeus monodon TaxID=6687 RepID=UPI0018A7043B|nr:uncharacterized protein LOC119598726 [Penaeus monodon]
MRMSPGGNVCHRAVLGAGLRLLELLLGAAGNNGNNSLSPIHVSGAVRPNLPVYQEGEDFACYLIRSERVASLLDISEDSYAVRLGSLLTGKAVEIYTSLSPEITADYKQLKKALLNGFSKTPNGYRQDFRAAKIKVGETYKQFSINLGRLFDQWIDSSGLENSYESLRSFMILDQFKSSLSPDLRIYIKEHNVPTLDQTVQLADNWAAAHNAYPKSNTTFKTKKSTENKPVNHVPVMKENFIKEIKCHNCGEFGHYRSRCPKNPLAFKSIPSERNPEKVSFSLSDSTPRKYLANGTVNGQRVSTILRDSGCSCVLISNEVLPDIDISNRVRDSNSNSDVFDSPVHKNDQVQAIQTRAYKNKRIHPLVLPKLKPVNITPTEFAKLQSSCPALSSVREKVKSREPHMTRDGMMFEYIENDGLLYRKCIKSKFQDRIGKMSLVVPADCRAIVTSIAHESPLAGHFSHRKTLRRVADQFYWPSMGSDTTRRASLKQIDSVSVAEALLIIFSRVGIPREILSDRGTQFTSQLMGELYKLLGIKPLFTTPYHPSGNGRVERFHSTLKASLRKLCVDKPKDWHRYLIPTLFALREIPSDRTGFFAFELLYGRAVRGPLTVLRDLWEDRSIKDDERTTFQYVIELRDKLEECAKIAAHNADISSTRYHRRASVSQAQLMDEVQVLESIPGNSDVAQSCVDVENDMCPITPDGRVDSLLSIDTSGAEINSELTHDQQNVIHKLVSEFSDVFSETPGCTFLVEHDISLSTIERLKPKIYPIPLHLQSHFE